MSSPSITDVSVRPVDSLDEYYACAELQEEIWGPGFREVVPPAVLMVAQKMGGVCAGAFDVNNRLLGFVFGITGVRHGDIAHWSDMLAVRREARGLHLGERLKQLQRELCLAVGVRTMYWTFDPLVARNAHFNLMRLGARASEYVQNMYGSNTGSPLHGALETDRWIAAWDLTGDADRTAQQMVDGHFVVRAADHGVLPAVNDLRDVDVVNVVVPHDHEQLALDERIAWRVATREAFVHYLERGYRVSGFQRSVNGAAPYYQLVRS